MSSENENSNTGTTEHRRSTKPIMEKRRRARINASLAELKSLLLEVMRREGSRHSKMEKADILEMTVRHLRQIQKQNFAAAVAADPSILNKYMSGFNECAAEVSRYLNTIDGVDPDIRARLLNHLANCVQGVSETPSPVIAPAASAHASGATIAHVRPIQAQPATAPAQVNIAPKPPVVTEVNNNTITALPLASPPLQQQQQAVSLVGGVPILPGKTSTGEFAFVIPSNVLASGQLPSYVIPVYTGAVNTSPVSLASTTKPLGSPPLVSTSPQQEACKLDFHISFPSDCPPKSPKVSTKHNVPNMEINNNYLGPNPPRAPEDDDVWRPW